MKNELFEELMNSIKEGGAIVRGDTKPSRSYNFNEPDVQAIRKQYGLTQEKFAQTENNSPALPPLTTLQIQQNLFQNSFSFPNGLTTGRFNTVPPSIAGIAAQLDHLWKIEERFVLLASPIHSRI